MQISARTSPRTLRPAALGLALLALSGCAWFKPKLAELSAPPSPMYDGLRGKSVAIVIYAQTATLNEYAGAREEISNFVATEMRLNLPTTNLLDAQDVINWQNSTINWYGLTPADIGRHFNVDRVLFIEVLDYSTRKPIGYSEMQGRLRARCTIVNSEREPGAAPTTAAAVRPPEWSGIIDTRWPARPLDPTQTNENAVRLRTLELFAQGLVGHFYDRPLSADR